ncbi:DUF3800 domain-containing protein [Patescibacteria group bacterium]|nr:DUF3800 domain-containing protein [Patescibacteria group bacterium]
MIETRRRPKRDFLFIDESGEPGLETDYYILGLVHLTDISFEKMNIHLGALRYFGNIKKELKSTDLNPLQREKLHAILKIMSSQGDFLKATAVFVRKGRYSGPYLLASQDSLKFRHYILRKLLECHFEKFQPQTNEIELILDRFHTGEDKERQMRNYLRTDRYNCLPDFLHIVQVDSRYIDFLQIADWVAGTIKEVYFTHPERKYKDLSHYIHICEITC